MFAHCHCSLSKVAHAITTLTLNDVHCCMLFVHSSKCSDKKKKLAMSSACVAHCQARIWRTSKILILLSTSPGCSTSPIGKMLIVSNALNARVRMPNANLTSCRRSGVQPFSIAVVQLYSISAGSSHWKTGFVTLLMDAFHGFHSYFLRGSEKLLLSGCTGKSCSQQLALHKRSCCKQLLSWDAVANT